MTPPARDHLKPLALLYQSVEFEAETVVHALETLELRVQAFQNPRQMLVNLRRLAPALCIVDLTTPETGFAVALIRTIRSMLGQSPPIVALVSADAAQAEAAKTALHGAPAVRFVQKPLTRAKLAQTLGAYVVTDAIAAAAGATIGRAPSQASTAPASARWIAETLKPLLTEFGGVLSVFDDSEAQLRFHMNALGGCSAEVIEMVRKLRRSEEKLDLFQSLRLYGVENTRNLVASRTAARLLSLKFGFNTKTGLLSEDPKKIVPYAVRASAHFGEGTRYQEPAFNVGLLFDLLSARAGDLPDRKRALWRLLEQSYVSAMRRADAGFRMGKSATSLALEKHLVSVEFTREAARIVLAIVHADYQDLTEAWQKKNLPLVVQQVLEQTRYGIHHGLVAALLCQATPGLGDAWRSALFSATPLLLAGDAKEADAAALAALCASL